MAKQTKKYAYKSILAVRSNVKGVTHSVIDDLNDFGAKGFRFVGTYTLPEDGSVMAGEYLLMEQEADV